MHNKLCPWCGMRCDCGVFPWMENGCVPQTCADKIRSEIKDLEQFRKLPPKKSVKK